MTRASTKFTHQFFGKEAVEVKILESKNPHAKKCAFVTLSSYKAISRALKKNNSYLEGSHINVEKPKQ